jgi:CDP-paratose 2-epimerase
MKPRFAETTPAAIGLRPVLVTGGAGFVGCNLADRLATEGNNVLVLDSLTRSGVERNLDWLRRRHPRRIGFLQADIRDRDNVGEAVADAEAVFHLAAQVAVTSSLDDPRHDAEVNVGGTLNVLEAVRRTGRAIPVVFASTNKVYGGLADIPLEAGRSAYRPLAPRIAEHGIGEDQPLDFHSPYGCSKGAADQYVLDYARSFGLPTAVLRKSCIYGPRQMGTEDQGWVAHFLRSILADRPITIYGDGRQVRDVLDVSDAVAAYFAAWRNIGAVAGRAFNIGGGAGNAVSLLDLLDFAAEHVGREARTVFAPWRQGDQRYYVSDTRLARRALGLGPPRPWREGVAGLLDWLRTETAGAIDESAATMTPAEVVS